MHRPHLNISEQQRINLQAHTLGVCLAACVLSAIFWVPRSAGLPITPKLSTTRFSVAVLAGVKQAEQKAPENAEHKVEATITPVDGKANAVAVADRQTSLPDAVKEPSASDVGIEITLDETPVIPPAKVSMPGGRLAVEDAPLGDVADPFAVGPKQVYIRLVIDATGRVVRGGIVRSGSEPMRDAYILKALASRTYDVNLLKIQLPGETPLWQLDQVIDYGSNELLP